MKGFEFDKEKAVVIGIALILLVAWGIWYPRQQARTAARNQERRAAIEAAARFTGLRGSVFRIGGERGGTLPVYMLYAAVDGGELLGRHA